MNTTTISPTLEVVAPKSGQGHASQPSDADGGARFSEVLSHQHASQSANAGQHQSTTTASKQKENVSANSRDSDHNNPEVAEELSEELLQLAGQAGIVPATAGQLHVDKIAAGLREPNGDARRAIPHALAKADPTAATSRLTAEAVTAKALNDVRLSPQTGQPDGKSDKSDVAALVKAATLPATPEKALSVAVNLHQSATPDAKAKQVAGNKIAQAMAANSANSAKFLPAPGKTNVGEFSAAMIDAAAHAQSRFATNGIQDGAAAAPASGDHSLVQTAMVTNSSSAIQHGSLVAVPGTATPLSSPQWATDFGRQFVNIAQNSSNGTQIAELRLDPPELGPLRITINLSDNVAHAAFFSAHAMVRQTVENALPQLQQLLAQAGISLGDTSVNDQGQAGQGFDDQSNNRHANGRTGLSTGLAAGDAVAVPERVRSAASNALVDTFA